MERTGDVNGDHMVDVIIGAPGMSAGAGTAYVLYGKTIGTTNIYLSALHSSDGFAILGASIADYFGLSVSAAGKQPLQVFVFGEGIYCLSPGDINGDGFGDVIIGALKTTNFYSGAVCIVYGNLTTFGNIRVGALGSRGFALSSDNWAWCGYSVIGAGG